MVVDIENVAGGAVMTEASAAWARDVVVSALAVSDGEQVVIGTSHVGLFHISSVWPGARLRVRSGPNGADLELLEVLTGEHVEERFDEVTLVSGDGIFAEAIAHLGAAGVNVTVASWVESISAKLCLAACRTVYLNDVTASAAEGLA
ncbi:NYN domain-containing protein [Pseudonocardia sp. Cha107L01]|uniref:NYN domain-containing protein n=1 Tax=Pseudonocardia sp. Cha107L01 TaxID=3457576 RepID=UPI00403E7412